MPLRFLAIGAFFIAAVLTACGGDDDPNPTAAPSVVHTQAPSTTTEARAAEVAPVLPASVTDKDGNDIDVTDVSRIVVLNGDIAEVVYALGLGENVAGVDISATYPEAARAKQNIGYQRTLSAEGILSLNPTLVIGNEVAGPPEVIEQIRGAGITTVILPDVASIDGVYTKIESVADALGVPNRGAELSATVRKEVEEALALAETATSEPSVAFLYLRGATTQMLMGRGSRADVLIAAAGATDAGVAAGINGAAPITPESLVTAAPDVILVLSAGLESVGGVEGLLAIPGIAQTPAGEARRVVDLDDQYLLGLGPRTGQALRDLVVALHPELK